MIGDISSGPSALELLVCLIASDVCVMVIFILSSSVFFLIFLVVDRKSLEGLVVAPGVNCLFSWLAILLWSFSVLPLKFIP